MTASAQTSLKRFPRGDAGFGIGFGVYASSPRFTGAVEYGVSNNTKAILEAGVEFTNDDELEAIGDISLSPTGSIQLTNVKPMPSGFELFTSGGFGVGFVDVVDDNAETVANRRDVALGLGVSILKRIEIEAAWVFKSYLGLVYDVLWALRDIADENDSDVSGDIGIRLGLETEISLAFSVLTGFVFSANNTETAFHIGVNYHRPSTERREYELYMTR